MSAFCTHSLGGLLQKGPREKATHETNFACCISWLVLSWRRAHHLFKREIPDMWWPAWGGWHSIIVANHSVHPSRNTQVDRKKADSVPIDNYHSERQFGINVDPEELPPDGLFQACQRLLDGQGSSITLPSSPQAKFCQKWRVIGNACGTNTKSATHGPSRDNTQSAILVAWKGLCIVPLYLKTLLVFTAGQYCWQATLYLNLHNPNLHRALARYAKQLMIFWNSNCHLLYYI